MPHGDDDDPATVIPFPAPSNTPRPAHAENAIGARLHESILLIEALCLFAEVKEFSPLGFLVPRNDSDHAMACPRCGENTWNDGRPCVWCGLDIGSERIKTLREEHYRQSLLDTLNDHLIKLRYKDAGQKKLLLVLRFFCTPMLSLLTVVLIISLKSDSQAEWLFVPIACLWLLVFDSFRRVVPAEKRDRSQIADLEARIQRVACGDEFVDENS